MAFFLEYRVKHLKRVKVLNIFKYLPKSGILVFSGFCLFVFFYWNPGKKMAYKIAEHWIFSTSILGQKHEFNEEKKKFSALRHLHVRN